METSAFPPPPNRHAPSARTRCALCALCCVSSVLLADNANVRSSPHKQLLSKGTYGNVNNAEFQNRLQNLQPTDLATLAFTSGMTHRLAHIAPHLDL